MDVLVQPRAALSSASSRSACSIAAWSTSSSAFSALSGTRTGVPSLAPRSLSVSTAFGLIRSFACSMSRMPAKPLSRSWRSCSAESGAGSLGGDGGFASVPSMRIRLRFLGEGFWRPRSR